MSEQPKALAHALAGLPDALDYDAFYAALMTTIAGRRFVAELTRRNRNTDTQMVVGAIARVEAALRGDPSPQIPAIVTRELTEVAAAIERAAREVAVVSDVPSTGISAALERIQDIAFVLHERPVEHSLCDALDSAVREITDRVADLDAAPQSPPRAAALLGALARRVSALIALAMESDGADLPSAPTAEAEAARSFKRPAMPAADDDAELAAAVAALAVSLPLAQPPESAADAENESDEANFAQSVESDALLPSQDFADRTAAVTVTPQPEPVTVATLPPAEGPPEAQGFIEVAPPETEGEGDADALGTLARLSEEELIALFS